MIFARMLAVLAALVAFVGAAKADNTGWGGVSCGRAKIYDASTSGATQLVAAGSSIYICGFSFFAGGTVNVSLVSGTGTNCATGQASITPAFQFTAQTGFSDASSFFRGLTVPYNTALCINTSAGVAVQAIVFYAQF